MRMKKIYREYCTAENKIFRAFVCRYVWQSASRFKSWKTKVKGLIQIRFIFIDSFCLHFRMPPKELAGPEENRWGQHEAKLNRWLSCGLCWVICFHILPTPFKNILHVWITDSGLPAASLSSDCQQDLRTILYANGYIQVVFQVLNC